MSYSSLKGLKVIAGSDPLPVAGEEDLAGTYASYFDAPFDSAKPAARLRHLLTDPTIRPVSLGRRGSVFQVWRRLQTYKKSRSAAT
jgi:hypothetical protein